MGVPEVGSRVVPGLKVYRKVLSGLIGHCEMCGTPSVGRLLHVKPMPMDRGTFSHQVVLQVPYNDVVLANLDRRARHHPIDDHYTPLDSIRCDAVRPATVCSVVWTLVTCLAHRLVPLYPEFVKAGHRFPTPQALPLALVLAVVQLIVKLDPLARNRRHRINARHVTHATAILLHGQSIIMGHSLRLDMIDSRPPSLTQRYLRHPATLGHDSPSP